MARGDYTRSARAQKAQAMEEHWGLVRLARDYARGHGLGARATVSTWLFPGVTYQVLNNALRDKIKAVSGTRYATEVLTEDEEQKLQDWIVASARGKSPATDVEISEKVVLMLKLRKAFNKKRKYGTRTGTIGLTPAEMRLATEQGAEVSGTWLARFQARHPLVRPMKERNADVTRTKKQNEGVVTIEALRRRVRRPGLSRVPRAHGHGDQAHY
jgi:hypothetical protein